MLGQTISHYRVEERIGVGAMGEVFRAFDTQLERAVAIKRLHADLTRDPDYRRRFMREARHAAQINHHGVAGVHDVVEQDGEFFLVMEYVEGQTLSKAPLDRSRIAELLKVMIRCAEALVAAHEIGVVHRDLKPANIMLTPSGEIKILDFGLARRSGAGVGDGSRDETATDVAGAGKVAGTLPYLAPEVLRGGPADHRSDLYSLGVVFYQILTGEYPFGAGTQTSIICNILGSTPVPIVRLNPVVPIELEECVFRLLEKDSTLRYASAQDLLAHLRKIERDLSFLHLHTMQVPPGPKWLRRHPYVAVALALLILAVPGVYLTMRLLPPPLPEHPALAVIPFESVSQDPASVSFTAGLSEMVSQRLSELSLGRPFTVIPSHYVRSRGLRRPLETETVGANLVLMGAVVTRNGNVSVALKVVLPGDGRSLGRIEVETPLSQPADLEYGILERSLRLLETGRDPPDRRVLKSYPNSQAAYDYFLRGLGSHLHDDPVDSIDQFQRALQMEPRFALAKAYLGLAFLRETDSDEVSRLQKCEQSCSEARDLDGQLQAADWCLGEAARRKGELNAALDAYSAAAQEGPLTYEVLAGLWGSSSGLGRPEMMVPILEAVIDRQPDLWVGYAYLAYAQYRLGKFEDAVEREKRAVELAPKRPVGYSDLAVFYDRLGCPEEAANTYQAALSLTRDSKTYTNLAVHRFYSGHYPEALEAAQEAKIYLDRETEPSYVESGNLGDIYYWAPGGNRETATVFYREALHLVDEKLGKEPDNLEALQSKCWYLAMLDQKDSAGRCLESVLAAPNLEFDSYFKVARTYKRLGAEGQALDYLKRSLEEGHPASPIRNEPIFRESHEVQELLSPYVVKRNKCP